MDRPSSLCPGYRQVEAFGPDDEYEEEEEVVYVTLDMGNVEPSLVPSSTSYRLIGLDTPTPFIQLQGTVLKGRHDLLLGTEIIFTDDKESHDWNKRSVIHVANTEQRIAFQEVTLIPKIKGKEKATDSGTSDTRVNFEPPPSDDRDIQIDRMTGLSGPIPRAPRTRKTSTNPKAVTAKKGKGKGKEKSESTSTQNSAKGKEKEDPQPEPQSREGSAMVEDPPPPDLMEDMYMDVE